MATSEVQPARKQRRDDQEDTDSPLKGGLVEDWEPIDLKRLAIKESFKWPPKIVLGMVVLAVLGVSPSLLATTGLVLLTPTLLTVVMTFRAPGSVSSSILRQAHSRDWSVSKRKPKAPRKRK
jgi:hypothetical protein